MFLKRKGNLSRVVIQTLGARFHNSQVYKQSNNLANESFLSGTNSVYIENLFDKWAQNRQSVHASWDAYFSNIVRNIEPAIVLPPEIGSAQLSTQFSQVVGAPKAVHKAIQETCQIYRLIHAYRQQGHEIADLDPLKYDDPKKIARKKLVAQNLSIESFGFTQADLKREFFVDGSEFGAFYSKKNTWTLEEVISTCKQLCCSKMTFEYVHISRATERAWIRDKISDLLNKKRTPEEKKKTLLRLMQNDKFNNFQQTKWNAEKRFGIEGSDAFIPGLGALFDKAADSGVKESFIGMAHRGRVNTLAMLLEKPREIIFADFLHFNPTEKKKPQYTFYGDVKYHKGFSKDVNYGKKDQHPLRLTVLPNPSHLEAVSPVVLGVVRGKQDNMKDLDRNKVLAVIVHGDGAYAGQGVCYEQAQLESLKDFTVGGSIHIVINNQVAFTTSPTKEFSTPNPTDLNKTIESLIIHVNGEAPDLVEQAFEFALEYRNQFKKDVVINMVAYRRYGHNEQDEPLFTNPRMYSIIGTKQPLYQQYRSEMIKSGILSENEIVQAEKDEDEVNAKAYKIAQENALDVDKILKELKVNMTLPPQSPGRNTAVPLNILKEVGEKVTTVPKDFQIHPKLAEIYALRNKFIRGNLEVDWATAESLAWATLLQDGFKIRLCGEDAQRGTFSHRHAALNNYTKDSKYWPIRSVLPEDKHHHFQVVNSPLSEYAVLAYEYGHSLVDKDTLTMWEAQFGDFVNGAQVTIDTFISSGEVKWSEKSGLTILLPHGYDGQGPEHSSSRFERFLELLDDNPLAQEANLSQKRDFMIFHTNMQVVNCTTAANYFHVLRRQMKREFRKPLVVIAPKKLLRFKPAMSKLTEMADGTSFKKVIDESFQKDMVEPKKMQKVVLCSGQVYYDLIDKRSKINRNDIAIIRVEQLGPFPYKEIETVLSKYNPNAEYIWCQEEPLNMGSWAYVHPRLDLVTKKLNLKRKFQYRGRPANSSSATGSIETHNKELQDFLRETLVDEAGK